MGSSLDAILLQQRGATALPLLTRPFAGAADRLLRRWRPDRELPVIAIDHPLQNISDEALASRAQQIADAITSYFERFGGDSTARR